MNPETKSVFQKISMILFTILINKLLGHINNNTLNTAIISHLKILLKTRTFIHERGGGGGGQEVAFLQEVHFKTRVLLT